jgi:fatty acid desaturase (delta-4 desaturase)
LQLRIRKPTSSSPPPSLYLSLLTAHGLTQPPCAPRREDPKWQQYKWTVYRGVAYDLTSFIERHPAGSWLINLAIGRDCTALFESYHLRPEVAAGRLARLPVLAGFPVGAVPRSPYPNDSEVYNAIRERVRKEVFKGNDVKGAHRSGSEGAAVAILGYAAAAYALYASAPNLLTGFLMGLGGAWIGLTVQVGWGGFWLGTAACSCWCWGQPM